MTKQFSRIKQLLAISQSALASFGLNSQAYALANNNLLNYRSRGKGGKAPTRTGHKHMAYVRQQAKKRNK